MSADEAAAESLIALMTYEPDPRVANGTDYLRGSVCGCIIYDNNDIYVVRDTAHHIANERFFVVRGHQDGDSVFSVDAGLPVRNFGTKDT